MNCALVELMKDKNLREEVKPADMSESKYQSLVIESYNRCSVPTLDYNKFKKKLKTRILLNSMVSL